MQRSDCLLLFDFAFNHHLLNIVSSDCIPELCKQSAHLTANIALLHGVPDLNLWTKSSPKSSASSVDRKPRRMVLWERNTRHSRMSQQAAATLGLKLFKKRGSTGSLAFAWGFLQLVPVRIRESFYCLVKPPQQRRRVVGFELRRMKDRGNPIVLRCHTLIEPLSSCSSPMDLACRTRTNHPSQPSHNARWNQ